MAHPIVHFLGGPPGTGKSTVAPSVVQLLQETHDRTVVLLDGDMFYSPQARVQDSERSGIALDTPEFARTFNLPRQLRFQKIVRSVAEAGCVVLCTAPFENMFSQVGDKPLWEKLKSEDFNGFAISMTYMLTVGDAVEEEIRSRLKNRGMSNPYQLRLDLPKIENPRYYNDRSALVRQSVGAFNFPLVEVEIEEPPEVTSQRISQEILMTESQWH